jgi:streptogramin lyase
LNVVLDDIWLRVCPSGPGDALGATFLVQVDGATGRVVRETRFATPAGLQVTALDRMVWVVSSAAAGVLQSLDPETGEAGALLPIGTPISNMGAGFGALWLSAQDQGALLRYDPSGSRSPERIELPGQPGFVLVTADAVWVALTDEPTLVKVDPDSNEVVALVPLGEGFAVEMAEFGGDLWVLTGTDIQRVAATEGAVAERWRLGTHSVAFPPQFVGPTYALGVGPHLWFVPPRGEMLRLSPTDTVRP